LAGGRSDRALALQPGKKLDTGIDMAFETLRPLAPLPAVHAKPEAARLNPDGQNKREGKGRQSRKLFNDEAHPVTNEQGQLTGKLIDTTV
jgi:hypothetical protein